MRLVLDHDILVHHLLDHLHVIVVMKPDVVMKPAACPVLVAMEPPVVVMTIVDPVDLIIQFPALVPSAGPGSSAWPPQVPGSLVRHVRREHEDDEGPTPDPPAATMGRHRRRHPRALGPAVIMTKMTEPCDRWRW